MRTILFVGDYNGFRDLIWKLEPIITKYIKHQATIYIGDDLCIRMVGIDIERCRGYKWGTNFIARYASDHVRRDQVVHRLSCRDGVAVAAIDVGGKTYCL